MSARLYVCLPVCVSACQPASKQASEQNDGDVGRQTCKQLFRPHCYASATRKRRLLSPLAVRKQCARESRKRKHAQANARTNSGHDNGMTNGQAIGHHHHCCDWQCSEMGGGKQLPGRAEARATHRVGRAEWGKEAKKEEISRLFSRVRWARSLSLLLLLLLLCWLLRLTPVNASVRSGAGASVVVVVVVTSASSSSSSCCWMDKRLTATAAPAPAPAQATTTTKLSDTNK